MIAGFEEGHYDVKMEKESEGLHIFVKKINSSSQPMAVVPTMSIVDPWVERPLLVPYIADTQSTRNMVAASCHRFGRHMDAPRGAANFLEYSKLIIEQKIPRVRADDIRPFIDILEKQGYPGGRKQQLKNVRRETWLLNKELARVKSFIKYELYEKPKIARAINSPSDGSKTILSAIMHCVDKALFSLPYFVKGTNPRDWKFIMKDLFGQEPVCETDFESFEAHHRECYSELVHFWIMHSIRDCGFSNAEKRLISRLVLGTNKCEYKYVTATIKERLMSGALHTSSANSLLNFLIMSYLHLQTLYPNATPTELVEHFSEFKGLFEGDDGITASSRIDQGLINGLGIKLTPKFHNRYNEAKFCGVMCDFDTGLCVKDPRKVLRNLFVLQKKFLDSKSSVHEGLLRARVLSLMYSFNECPMIAPLCQAVCDATASVDLRRAMSETGYWDRPLLEKAVKERVWRQRPEIKDSTRALMYERFGIHPREQLAFEASVRGQCRPFKIDLRGFLSKQDLDHAINFVFEKSMFYPPQIGRTTKVDEIIEARSYGDKKVLKLRGVDKDFAEIGAHVVPTREDLIALYL